MCQKSKRTPEQEDKVCKNIMALYNVLYTNRVEMSIINDSPFTDLDKAIAFADSQVEGMEKCNGDPYTDLHPSCCYTVTTAPAESDDLDEWEPEYVYETDWYWE